jgi:EmrB/QacA subfamily drug resistance transporter
MRSYKSEVASRKSQDGGDGSQVDDGTFDDSAGNAGHHLQGAKRFEVVAAVMTVMFFSAMAQTVVSTALPNIVADLHGLSLYAWVFTAFILASAVVIPIYGTLSDVFGRKPLFVVAITLYAVGNFACGFAQNMEMLVAARAISGMGAGGLQALAQITIGDVFTPRERGRWMGLMMSAFGLASIIGPTMGGLLTDGPGWRWVFWINIPVSILPLVALLYALPTVRRPRKIHIDYPGIACLTFGLVPILLAITWLGENYGLSSPRVAVGLAMGFGFLILFIMQELRTDFPIIDPAFFRNRIFVIAMIATFCVALGMYGSIMFIPLFVQGVIGTSARDSGVVLAPMMLGFMAGSVVSGQLVSRWGRYRIQALCGLAVAIFGMFLYGRLDVASSNVTVVRNMLIFGVGIGSTMPLFTIAVQNAFPYRVLGAATAARQFFMALGGAIGVPIMGALLNSGFQAQFTKHLSPALLAMMKRNGTANLDPNTLISPEAQAAIRTQFAHAPQLYHQFIFTVRDSLALTMQPLFHLALWFLVASLVTTVFLKEIPLRGRRIDVEAVVVDGEASLVGATEPAVVQPAS